MSRMITAQKRLVTLHVNKLTHIVSKIREESLHEEPIGSSLTGISLGDVVAHLHETITAITFASSKVEASWKEFASISGSGPKEEEETSDYEAYTTKAESALADA
ncbi:unnamed protein product [Haemonchus placei]|uniref:MDMPI_N domain-containing protein n=1 Tax=Haemonchus placei TaxID=6290 RepID=A0A0N4WKK1_HAEPC|nr:unnamed protein product [Haemonchus placei]